MGDFYEKYTAFECAYHKATNTERINKSNVFDESENRVFETRHLKYSHAPEKLEKVDNVFFTYIGLIIYC